MEIGKIRIKKDLDAAPALKGFVVSEAPAIGLPPETLAFFAASYAIADILSSLKDGGSCFIDGAPIMPFQSGGLIPSQALFYGLIRREFPTARGY